MSVFGACRVHDLPDDVERLPQLPSFHGNLADGMHREVRDPVQLAVVNQGGLVPLITFLLKYVFLVKLYFYTDILFSVYDVTQHCSLTELQQHCDHINYNLRSERSRLSLGRNSAIKITNEAISEHPYDYNPVTSVNLHGTRYFF